jgi:hypothetical protein
VLVGVFEEGGDFLFLPSVERAGIDFAAVGFDLLGQGRELLAVTAASEDGEAFGGELLGNLAADEIAGADHGDRSVSLLQGPSPGV